MGKYVLTNMVKQKGAKAFILFSLASFLIASLSPYLNGSFLDLLSSDINLNEVFFCAIFIAAVGIGGAFLSYLANMTTIKVITKTSYSLLFEVVRHLQNATLQYVENMDSAYVTQRVYTDVFAVSNFVISNFLLFFLNFFLIVGIFVFYIVSDIALFVISTVFIIPYFFLFVKVKRPLYEASREKKESDNSTFNSIAFQIANVFYTQLDSTYEAMQKLMENSFAKFFIALIKSSKLNYLVSSSDSMIMALFQACMLIYGGYQIYSGNMTVGNFIIVNSYFSLLSRAVKYYANLFKQYQDAVASFSRINEYNNVPQRQFGNKIISHVDSVEIHGLNFQVVGGHSQKELYNGFQCTLNIGRRYMIQGENGSGKSTLVKIITGLYRTVGIIYINNIPLESLDIPCFLSKHVSVVPQKLFSPMGTVCEFLSFRFSCLEKDIRNMILKKMIFSSFVASVLDRECRNLSGGELRKLFIWIAVSRSSEILILDEPTTGLDDAGRKDLINYIEDNPQNQILLICSHDVELQAIVDETFLL